MSKELEFRRLRDRLHQVRHMPYSSDPELREAMAEAVEVAVIEMLDLLASKHS